MPSLDEVILLLVCSALGGLIGTYLGIRIKQMYFQSLRFESDDDEQPEMVIMPIEEPLNWEVPRFPDANAEIERESVSYSASE